MGCEEDSLIHSEEDGLPIAVYRSRNNEYTVFDPDKLRGDITGFDDLDAAKYLVIKVK